jgi:hypothetical protein
LALAKSAWYVFAMNSKGVNDEDSRMSATCADETFYTSVLDSMRWSTKVFGTLGIILIVVSAVSHLVNPAQEAFSITRSLEGLLIISIAGACLGLLLFIFGWMGRVTISTSGVKAPFYSGKQGFLRWDEITNVAPGSLGGWPCTIISGSDARKPLYLMPLGGAKSLMIQCVARHADSRNPLAAYFESQS